MINQINIIEDLEKQLEETQDSIQDLLTHAKVKLFAMFQDVEHWTKMTENRQHYDDYIHYRYTHNKHEYDVWPASVTITKDSNYCRYSFSIREREIHAIHHAVQTSHAAYEDLRSKFDSDAFVNAFEGVVVFVSNQEKIKSLKQQLIERKTLITSFAQAIGLSTDPKLPEPISLAKDESVIPEEGTIAIRDGEIYESDGRQWLHVGSVVKDDDEDDDDGDHNWTIHSMSSPIIIPPSPLSSWEKLKQKFKK